MERADDEEHDQRQDNQPDEDNGHGRHPGGPPACEVTTIQCLLRALAALRQYVAGVTRRYCARRTRQIVLDTKT